MKILPPAVLACAILFFISCGTVDLAKKYPHMVADADPVSAGTVEVQFDRFFSSKVDKTEIEVIFYPRLNAVALGFRYQLINHRQFWDQAGRRQFAEAVERYKTDFSEQNLGNQYRKTRAAYGKVQGRTEWETFKLLGKTRIAHPVIELGYRFREGMPFFTTLMRSAKEESDPGDSSAGESQQLNMYFTRAQAEVLAAVFDQAFLMGLLERGPDPESESDEPPVETSYKEYGDS